LDPTFAITFQELKEKVIGENKIGKDTTLIIQGLNNKL
jgi:hypothetical protein